MMYDRQYWLERLPFIQAFADNQDVRVRGANQDHFEFTEHPDAYSIVRPPKFRPLRLGEIHAGDRLRMGHWKPGQETIVLTTHQFGVAIAGFDLSWEDLMNSWQRWNLGSWVDCKVPE